MVEEGCPVNFYFTHHHLLSWKVFFTVILSCPVFIVLFDMGSSCVFTVNCFEWIELKSNCCLGELQPIWSALMRVQSLQGKLIRSCQIVVFDLRAWLPTLDLGGMTLNLSEPQSQRAHLVQNEMVERSGRILDYANAKVWYSKRALQVLKQGKVTKMKQSFLYVF